MALASLVIALMVTLLIQAGEMPAPEEDAHRRV